MAASWALLGHGGAPRPLAATQSTIADVDRDGVPDRQEEVLGTDPHMPDSDFDGYTDGEELALQTDPTQYWDVPDGSEQLSIGMSARGEGGKLLVHFSVYAADGNLGDKILRVGKLVNRGITDMTLERLQPFIQVSELTTPHGGLLRSIDLEVPEQLVQKYGKATFFAAVGVPGNPKYASVDKVDINCVGGVTLLRREVTAAGPGGSPEVTYTINYPIPSDGDGVIPIDWEEGKVCAMVTQVIGVAGNMVLHQVISAECEESWDTYCESDCEGQAGSTYETVDPGAILGG